jgi:hypothetical protein
MGRRLEALKLKGCDNIFLDPASGIARPADAARVPIRGSVGFCFPVDRRAIKLTSAMSLNFSATMPRI